MESYSEFARRARIMTEVHAEKLESGAAKLAAHSLSDGVSGTPAGIATVTASSDGSKGAKKAKEAKAKSLKRL